MQPRTAEDYQGSALVLRVSGQAGISREHELLRHDPDTQTYFRVLYLAPKARGFTQAHECFAEKAEVMALFGCKHDNPSLPRMGWQRCFQCGARRRYRKFGDEPGEWTRSLEILRADSEDVLSGTNETRKAEA